ncbi:hypothetical protein P3L10_010392 [Capsicum annuum]
MKEDEILEKALPGLFGESRQEVLIISLASRLTVSETPFASTFDWPAVASHLPRSFKRNLFTLSIDWCDRGCQATSGRKRMPNS